MTSQQFGPPYRAEELRQEAQAEAAEPVDEEMLLVGEYLAGRLPAGEAAGVEGRLSADPAFRQRVEPLLALRAVESTPPVVREPPGRRGVIDRLRDWFVFGQPSRVAMREPTERPQARYSGSNFPIPRREVIWRRAMFGVILVSVIAPEGGKLFMRLVNAFVSREVYVQVSADAGRVVPLERNATAGLDPGARLMVDDRLSIQKYYLDGAGRFAFPSMDGVSFWRVETGSAMVTCGACEVRIDATDPAATRVLVHSGVVQVRSRHRAGGRSGLLPVKVGEELVVRFGEGPLEPR